MRYTSPLSTAILFLTVWLFQSCNFSADVIKKQDLQKMTPAQALQRLIDGNKRFQTGGLKQYRLKDQAYYLGKNNAYPPAIVLCSPDSRVAPELIFNQGLGDIYVLRTPASIATLENLGAMEHAAREIGSKVLVILQQSKDPYIEAAIDMNNAGNFAAINYHIRPALDNIKRDPNWKRWRKDELITLVTREHLLLLLAKVKNTSAILRGKVESGELTIVAGMYDIETGKVSFLNSDE
jgi:carbonic anhydrase